MNSSLFFFHLSHASQEKEGKEVEDKDEKEKGRQEEKEEVVPYLRKKNVPHRWTFFLFFHRLQCLHLL
jgi:hypothetical protein